MNVYDRNEDEFINEFKEDSKEVFKSYMNGVDYLFKKADEKVSSRIKNKTFKKAYNSKAAKVTRALLAAGVCMMAFPAAEAVMFSSGPSDPLADKLFAVLYC